MFLRVLKNAEAAQRAHNGGRVRMSKVLCLDGSRSRLADGPLLRLVIRNGGCGVGLANLFIAGVNWILV